VRVACQDLTIQSELLVDGLTLNAVAAEADLAHQDGTVDLESNHQVGHRA
jgi:hypothetical protein